MRDWRRMLTGFLRDVFFSWGPGARVRHLPLKEDAYPKNRMRGVDLIWYQDSVEYYIAMYEQARAAYAGGQRLSDEEANLAWRRRVHATNGLHARGAAAVPYLLKLLTTREPDAREDAAWLLGELGRDDTVVDALLEQLSLENDDVARTAIVEALGRLGSPRAIPALGRLIREAGTDADRLEWPLRSLGAIAGHDFGHPPDAAWAASAWLRENGYE